MVKVELTKAQHEWVVYWLQCYQCGINCKSGNCRWCRINANSLQALMDGRSK